jgi:hypothetical protein
MSDRNLAEVGGFAAGPVLAGVATRLVMRARGQTTTNTPTEELMKQALAVQLAVAGLRTRIARPPRGTETGIPNRLPTI